MIAEIKELRQRAENARHEHRYDEAIALYEQAVALCRELNDPLFLAHTIRHLGDVHYEAGQHELAMPHLVEAVAIYRKHDPRPLDLANAIRSLAIAREDAGALNEALRLWEEAHELYVATNIEPGIAETARRVRRIRG